MRKGVSTLRSFSYSSYKGVDDLPEEVLSLFSSMIDRPDKPVEYSMEIINAALEGRIDLHSPFNLDAYEYTIRNNAHMNEEKSRSKNVFIDFGSNDSERESSLRNGGMTVDVVSASTIKDLVDAFDEVVNSSELQFAVESIEALKEEFVVEFGVNLVSLIQNAVAGYPLAVAKLKEVCAEFEVVGENVRVILQSGQDVKSCFGAVALS